MLFDIWEFDLFSIVSEIQEAGVRPRKVRK
jgi:hypothetical protein